MDVLGEFKKFIMRGNVVDLAVGVVIGAAFSKIVSALVDDIIMPVVGALTSGIDFSNYYIPLSSAIQGHPPLVEAKKLGAVLAYGDLVNVIVYFLIVSFILFLVLKQMERFTKKEEEAPAPLTRTEVLLAQIRDELQKK